jgi:hypothetical protein
LISPYHGAVSDQGMFGMKKTQQLKSLQSTLKTFKKLFFSFFKRASAEKGIFLLTLATAEARLFLKKVWSDLKFN